MLALRVSAESANREPWQLWVGTIAFFLLLYLLHRLLLKLEKKGIVKYSGRPSGRGAPAILEIQSIFEPTKRHVLEEKLTERKRDHGARRPGQGRRQRGKRRQGRLSVRAVTPGPSSDVRYTDATSNPEVTAAGRLVPV